MRAGATSGGEAATAFRESAFRRLPLACMGIAAAAGLVGGSRSTEVLGPLPWLVSLGLVGLPHGAADFAVSRRVCRGWSLAAVWVAYVLAMAAVAAAFAAAPGSTIVAFAAVSCWHFGTAHLDSSPPAAGRRMRTVAALARGCAVLSMPFVAWPRATALAASDLASLPLGHGMAADLLPPAAVRTAGVVLAVVAVTATAIEGLLTRRRPGGPHAWHALLVELGTIAMLGWCTDALFSVGLYFLVWHAWRQMGPLAESLTGSAPRSWRELGPALVRVHVAALPLLIPTWAAIGVVWWQWSSEHTIRDLTVVSIAAYLVVTPAHELLGDLLRSPAGRRTAAASRRSPSGFVGRAPAGRTGSCST